MSQTKLCPKCGITKAAEKFSKHRNRADGLQSTCTACRNAHNKAWYADNADVVYARNKNFLDKRFQWYYSLFEGKSCVDCGETRIPALQYDHRDLETKVFVIAEGASKGYSKQRMLAEIAKCDIRCANCHAVRTAEQFQWYVRVDREPRVVRPSTPVSTSMV